MISNDQARCDLETGKAVLLKDEWDCIVHPGWHIITSVNEDGSFHVGGNTAVWPRRVAQVADTIPA